MKTLMQSKPMGFRLGVAFVIVGVFLGLLNHFLIFYNNSTVKLLISFPVFSFQV